MLSLPESIMTIFDPFSQLFSKRVWPRAYQLWAGAILCRNQRTVASVLRVLGLDSISNYCSYHRVLNKARWSALSAARLLLGQLVNILPDDEPVFIGIDETIERRSGKRIMPKGVYYDSARSFPKRIAYTQGLQWICMMLIVRLPFSRRRWALPFLTVLSPSKKHNEQQAGRHKTILDWSLQMVAFVARFLKDKPVYLLGDGNYAAVALGHRCRQYGWHLVSRLRFDARLHDFKPQFWNKPGRRPSKGQRQPSLTERANDPATKWQSATINNQHQQKHIQYLHDSCLWYRAGLAPLPIRWVITKDRKGKVEAFFSTDTTLNPQQIIEYYFQRWNVEVTFEEARAHLGIETQRQWSPKAIHRTTPILMALFSVVTLAAVNTHKRQITRPFSTAWYSKSDMTFSDVLTQLRISIYRKTYLEHSMLKGREDQLNTKLSNILIYQLARAA